MTAADKNRRYHAAHRDAILARQRARYAVKRAADLARKQARRRANPDECRNYGAAYYVAHADRIRAGSRAYTIAHPEIRRAWRERHKERLKQYAAQWARDNAGPKRAATARRLAAKLQATPRWANLAEITDIYREARRLSDATGIKHEVDHIVPLKSPLVCGLHVACNLQILTKRQNRRKWNHLRPPASWFLQAWR